METSTINLNLKVKYDLDGEAVDTLRDQLRYLINHAVANGQLTGETSATVISWEMQVHEDPEEPDEAGERRELTLQMFSESLEENCERIFPEQAFREVCLAEDGAEWRRWQDRQTNGQPRCKLELEDAPAFRRGLNDYADSMVKDRQWVTFDNGASYFAADDVKETIAAFDDEPYTYVLQSSLRSIIDFWL